MHVDGNRESRPSELELFIELVRHVVRQDGFDRLAPTVFLPGRNEVRILDHLEARLEPRAAALDWVLANVEAGAEVLLAIPAGPERFRVLWQRDGRTEEREVPVED